MEVHILVVAICGATTFLCKHGLLDNVKHTGDSLELLQKQKDIGEMHFISQHR